MKKSNFILLFLFAFVFLAVSAAYAVTGTLANEIDALPSEEMEHAEIYGEKVVPAGWCLSHGYIALWNPDNPYDCVQCD